MEGFIGEIRMFGGNFAPRNWSFCEGQLLSISQNTALFSILGTTYGGDGRTTFGLPPLKGRAAMHAGNGPGLTPRRLGAKFGSETETINTLTLANHNHLISSDFKGEVNVSSGDGTSNEPTDNILAASGTSIIYAAANEADEKLGRVAVTGSITLNNTGGSQAHNNIQPSLGIYYIICLYGTFPSRS